MSRDKKHRFFVSSFTSPSIFTLEFDSIVHSLTVIASNDEGNGGHSWLCLDTSQKTLYATVWSIPPSLAAYSISYENYLTLKLINTVLVNSISGYVCCSEKSIYSVGGPSGEVFDRDLETGGFKSIESTQKLSFQEEKVDLNKNWLKYGAHSVDLSPNGKSLYIADM
jgi:carboxy-cis,cis-muconate cyclase